MVVFFLQRAYFCRLLVCKWSNSFSGLAEWERAVVNIFLHFSTTKQNVLQLAFFVWGIQLLPQKLFTLFK